MCNDNIKYAGVIRAARGRIDPSSIETALTATGKHSFDIEFLKDYCSGDDAEPIQRNCGEITPQPRLGRTKLYCPARTAGETACDRLPTEVTAQAALSHH